jgi:beta propeller repeat protein
VYLLDLRTNTIEQLTSTPQDEGRPDVYGDFVVFERGTGAASRIVVYDLVFDVETTITAAESHFPRIAGSIVAWEDRRSGNSDIYLHDLSTGTELEYIVGPDEEVDPDLRGNTLAYLSDATGAWQVHMVNLTTGVDTEIGQTAANQVTPMVDWFYVGWSDARAAVPPLDENANWNAFAIDVDVPGTEDVLSNAAGAQILGGVDGRVFVWSDRRSGNWDIGVSAFGGAEVVVTMSTATQADPTVSGGLLAWEDNRLGSFDIYASSFGGSPATGANWLRINEILADPGATDDPNGDGTPSTTQDEYIEIVNVTDVALDLGGCTISDSVQVRHTFPAGTIVPAGGAIVVFAGGAPAGRFGGVIHQVTTTTQLGFNNGGDTVTLRAADGVTTIDTMTYGSEGGNDDALVRSPELTGPFVRHSTVTPGVRFSPGTTVDGFGH